ncbi:energy transducer TonB [Nonlabens ulvanivorans]|uniref:Regulatory sensor-transducer n=1 Tax=Nonlabens ulvanivorans TaxID=906888 RepID=A0A090WMD2_NONUL|nr:energy transducer TonB [Nonlabens ulvanivorans]GAL76549.1 regulatory sensor-transducer [Nonlabens ulvanivorans]
MKNIIKITAINFLLFLSLNCYSQDVKIFYKDGTLFQSYDVRNKIFKNGMFKQFHNNGKLAQEGRYNKYSDRAGEWKYYDLSGRLQLTVNYLDDDNIHTFQKSKLYIYDDDNQNEIKSIAIGETFIGSKYIDATELQNSKYLDIDYNNKVSYDFPIRSGVWKHYNFISNELIYKGETKWIENSGENVRVGVWEFYHPNGKIKVKGNYKNGLQNGEWKAYNTNGELIESVTFNAGKIINDGLGNSQPQFPGGNNNIMRFIQKYFDYPDISGVSGVIIAEITIDKEGNVINPKIIQSLHPEFDKAYLDVFNKMPKWSPGTINGEFENITFKIPTRVSN